MTERERMEAGLIYDCGSDEIMPEQMQYQDALWRFNHMGPSEIEERQELMKEMARSGASLTEIMEVAGCSEPTARKYMKETQDE